MANHTVMLSPQKDMIIFWTVHRPAKTITSAAPLAEILQLSQPETPVPASSGGPILLPKQSWRGEKHATGSCMLKGRMYLIST